MNKPCVRVWKPLLSALLDDRAATDRLSEHRTILEFQGYDARLRDEYEHKTRVLEVNVCACS